MLLLTHPDAWPFVALMLVVLCGIAVLVGWVTSRVAPKTHPPVAEPEPAPTKKQEEWAPLWYPEVRSYIGGETPEEGDR